MKINNILNKSTEEIVNRIIIGFCLFGTIIILFLSKRTNFLGKTTVDLYIYLVMYVLLVLITFFRKRISTQTKIIITTMYIFIMVIISLLTFGILSSPKIFILGIPIVLSFTIGHKKAFISIFIFLLIYNAIGYLYTKDILHYKYDINNYATMIYPWILDSIIIFYVSWGLLTITNNYKKNIIHQTNEIKSQYSQLSENEIKFRTVFNEASDAIIITTIDGEICDCNLATCQLFDFSKEELLSMNIKKLRPEYQPNNLLSSEKEKQVINLVLKGFPQKFEWQYYDRKKKIFFASVAINKIQFDSTCYSQVIIRDITNDKEKDIKLKMYHEKLEELVIERTQELTIANAKLKASHKKLNKKNQIIIDNNAELRKTLRHLKDTQTQLIQAEKMASIGTLTAGVAHEINNPLNYIRGAHFGLLQYFNDFGSQDKENTDILLDSIDNGIKRTTEIVKGLNQSSRKNNDFNEKCDIHAILDNCLVVLHNRLKDNVSISKEYHNTPIITKGNVGKLHQAFINILSNANYAIKEKGKINIKTSLSNKICNINITDNGSGIDRKIISQICDPFFTTKPPGEGTGIGMYVTLSILREHNGNIEIESEINKGTTVKISLPYNT